MLDSVQGRGPCLAFLPYVSLPELEGCIVTWDFIETIHSRSLIHTLSKTYTQTLVKYLIQLLKMRRLRERSKSVTNHYDELIDLGMKYQFR